MTDREILVNNLKTVLECLAKSQAVHQEWLDWYVKYPEEIHAGHTAGGPNHHLESVAKYDRRISAVERAIKYIETN